MHLVEIKFFDLGFKLSMLHNPTTMITKNHHNCIIYKHGTLSLEKSQIDFGNQWDLAHYHRNTLKFF